MWHLVAKSLSRFPDVIVTAMSIRGYPVSVMQRSPRYDATTGEMPVLITESVDVVPGPANVLAHYHDENLWNLQTMRIKGRLEKCHGDWIFVSTAFTPPPWEGNKSRWRMATTMRRTSRRYLATRGLEPTSQLGCPQETATAGATRPTQSYVVHHSGQSIVSATHWSGAGRVATLIGNQVAAPAPVPCRIASWRPWPLYFVKRG